MVPQTVSRAKERVAETFPRASTMLAVAYLDRGLRRRALMVAAVLTAGPRRDAVACAACEALLLWPVLHALMLQPDSQDAASDASDGSWRHGSRLIAARDCVARTCAGRRAVRTLQDGPRRSRDFKMRHYRRLP